MDIRSAYKTLEMSEDCSDEDLKAQYKRLTFQYHPDRNPEAPDKLKLINEAYQYIQDYKANPEKYNPTPFSRSPFGGMQTINISDLFGNGFGQQQKQISFPPININVVVSFRQSIQGVDKDLQFNKHIKCSKCNGQGNEQLGNGCQNCNGKGRINSQQGNMMFSGTCNKCYGRNIKTKACEQCNSTGVQEVVSNLTIHIPPGITDNSIMRLKNAGNYTGQSIFGDAATDVFVNVRVEKEEGLILEGADVVSHLRLSLLQALTGVTKAIKTIIDTRDVQVHPGAKNKEEIILDGLGVVSANGKQRVILDIDYPNDIDDLINYLKSKEN